MDMAVKTPSSPMQKVMDGLRAWARINSPWVIHYNSGSCNGCELEIHALSNPVYDCERFGFARGLLSQVRPDLASTAAPGEKLIGKSDEEVADDGGVGK